MEESQEYEERIAYAVNKSVTWKIKILKQHTLKKI